MCLSIKYKPHMNKGKLLPLVAKKEILVYKEIYIGNTSFFRGFRYEPNKLYRLRKALSIIRHMKHGDTINQGFHAFTRKAAQAKAAQASYGTKMVKFYIPKGAKYYMGTHADIVSTSIRSGDLLAV
jgi:hypothetical protein